LDYESARKINSSIIYVSTSMQGQSGPFAKYAGVGSQIGAVAGFGEISGWPGEMPSPPYGAYSDYYCQRFLSAALIVALDYRKRTGKGQWIEQSQLETSLYLNGTVHLDYAVNEHIFTRCGNRLSYAAPHGVYPAKGEDRWVAIAVFDDSQWQSLCKCINTPELAEDTSFKTLTDRKNNEDNLDNIISAWTGNQEPYKIERLLQDNNVPCSVVQKSSDLYSDPQLAHRKYYVELEHPEIGATMYPQQADYILSKTPRELNMPSPCLGEHNEYVFKDLLGLSDDEFADCIISGAITFDLPEGSEFTANM
jgi:benzylsuccinate CoA-transferase BbsF subunit